MTKKLWIKVAFVVVVVLVPLVVIFFRHRPITSSDWAAWLQAFGSVLAIVAAAVIAAWQRFEERRHTASRDRAVGQVVADTVVINAIDTYLALETMIKVWELEIAAAKSLSKTGEKIEILRKIPASSDEQLIHLANVWPIDARALAIARSELESLIDSMSEYRTQVLNGWPIRDNHATDIVSDARRLIEIFKKAIYGIQHRPALA